jgi:hypothetical protein
MAPYSQTTENERSDQDCCGAVPFLLWETFPRQGNNCPRSYAKKAPAEAGAVTKKLIAANYTPRSRTLGIYLSSKKAPEFAGQGLRNHRKL